MDEEEKDYYPSEEEFEKMESEMSSIFNELKHDENLTKAIDQVFDETNNLDEIQTKIILLVREYAKEMQPKMMPGKEDIGFDDKEVVKDINKLSRSFFKDKNQDIDKKLAKVKQKDPLRHITGQSKKDFKRAVKRFAIYEVYKVMNPKRIAGETKKDNYAHNMMRGGKKLASKHEGGRKSDLAKYSPKFIKKVAAKSKSFKGRSI